ncbi:hypothetical protein E4656_16560 [Natronospirillum operosum]|uniref:Cytoplasmic protein n=1 Tax=Natronospirillum operosum TaxID=2759953 RepID=A0A4Z0WAE5_9GAMM|nr:hypothetical protein [Natronospirillum operosum]TGG91331.1 hypothetical protein E4656_16560 [Natronospirillum operosum]
MSQQLSDLDLSLDANNLYRDEVITDLRAGTLRQLTPVTVNGERDENRAIRFHGQTQIMTQAGALPVNFDIEADSLEEAVEKFGAAARQGMEDTIKQIEEMRREQASSIVVPGQEGGGFGGGQGGGSGLKF